MSWLWGESEQKAEKKVELKEIVPRKDEDMLIRQLDALLRKLTSSDPMLEEVKGSLSWKTRFLWGSGEDPIKAAEAVKRMLEKREKEDLKNCLKWQIKDVAGVSKEFPFNCFYGCTKQGLPISVSLMGNSDVYKAQERILKTYSKTELENGDHGELALTWLKKGYFQQLEFLRTVLMKKASEKHGRDVFQCFLLVDVAGFSMSQIMIPFWMMSFIRIIIDVEDTLYPGLTCSAAIINVNSFFSTAWKAISVILPTELRDRIQIFSEDWKEPLSDIIDADSLPPELGGKGPPIFDHPDTKQWRKLIDANKTEADSAEAAAAKLAKATLQEDGAKAQS